MKNEKGIWKVWKYSQMRPLVNMKWSKGCWLRDNKQENSGTFWWITKDISFHSNKVFYTKRQVTLNFPEWASNIHTSFPCETTKPKLVGQMFSSPKKRQILYCEMALENDSSEQVTGSGPCLYLVVVSCENYRSVQIKQRLDTKNSGWRKMPLIQE